MSEDANQPSRKHSGWIRDARGRRVTQMGPVKLHLLNLQTDIPADTLRSMTDQIMPGARRQRLVQILTCIFGFILVGGGTIAYFKFFSTWRGLDPVLATIYSVQFVSLLAGPYLAFRIARAKYIGRIRSVMLEHQHCPHCGYDLQGLPPDAQDHTTVCPECGCAWLLEQTTSKRVRSSGSD